jgi:hypothetical protein
VYQSDVQVSYDDRTIGMCGEATMAESWKGVGKAVMAETHKAQGGGGVLVGCDAHTGSKTSVGTLQAR